MLGEGDVDTFNTKKKPSVLIMTTTTDATTIEMTSFDCHVFIINNSSMRNRYHNRIEM